MGGNLVIAYDKEGDVLDLSIGRPKKAISKEVMDDLLIRLDIKTKKVIEFSILNFEK